MVTQSKEYIRRTVPLRVKLSPDMAARLESISRPRGVTAATLAALIVGEYVDRVERREKEQHGLFEGSRVECPEHTATA
jgi:hypothetical protein